MICLFERLQGADLLKHIRKLVVENLTLSFPHTISHKKRKRKSKRNTEISYSDLLIKKFNNNTTAVIYKPVCVIPKTTTIAEFEVKKFIHDKVGGTKLLKFKLRAKS